MKKAPLVPQAPWIDKQIDRVLKLQDQLMKSIQASCDESHRANPGRKRTKPRLSIKTIDLACALWNASGVLRSEIVALKKQRAHEASEGRPVFDRRVLRK